MSTDRGYDRQTWNYTSCQHILVRCPVVDTFAVLRVVQVVEDCKSIVSHSHRSDNSKRELEAAQRLWKLKEKRLKKWCDTRWWTLTDMVESVAENEGPIGIMIDRARSVDKNCKLATANSPRSPTSTSRSAGNS